MVGHLDETQILIFGKNKQTKIKVTKNMSLRVYVKVNHTAFTNVLSLPTSTPLSIF